MHLFYNVGKDMIRLWCSGGNDSFCLGKNAIKEIDRELQRFGDGIPSQLYCRPRALSKHGDWKSAEVKNFSLSHSLIALDGYLPKLYVSGWALFVELVDLCWRPELTEHDIKEVGRLSRAFYPHYERDYFGYQRDRIGLCKYVFHLLLHLEEDIRENGPPVGYSQYWMERYIGWILGRLNARRLAAASLFKNAVVIEAVKAKFKMPFNERVAEFQDVQGGGGFRMMGAAHNHRLDASIASDQRLFTILRGYLTRKYEGMTNAEAENTAIGDAFPFPGKGAVYLRI